MTEYDKSVRNERRRTNKSDFFFPVEREKGRLRVKSYVIPNLIFQFFVKRGLTSSVTIKFYN